MCFELQALGLAVLMARAGLAVPASHPVVLPPFTSVLADIGDTQSLQTSLSTFSGHLMRIKVQLIISQKLFIALHDFVMKLHVTAM